MRSRALVDRVTDAGRDLAQPVQVEGDTDVLHARQHAHERQFYVAEEASETEAVETRLLLGAQPPGEHGACRHLASSDGPSMTSSASTGGEHEEVALRSFGRQEVGGDGGVERRPAGRPGAPGQRLGVVDDHVGGQAPEASQASWETVVERTHVAPVVDGDETLAARAGGAGGERALPLLETRRQRPGGFVDDEPRPVDRTARPRGAGAARSRGRRTPARRGGISAAGA